MELLSLRRTWTLPSELTGFMRHTRRGTRWSRIRMELPTHKSCSRQNFWNIREGPNIASILRASEVQLENIVLGVIPRALEAERGRQLCYHTI